MNNIIKTVAAIILVAFITVGISYLVYAATQNINNTAHINSAAQLGLSTSTFDWGNLDPGAQDTRTVTVTNNGDNPTTTLTFGVNGSTGGTLTWDATGKTIAGHGSSLDIIFTYTAGATSGDFSWDIDING